MSDSIGSDSSEQVIVQESVSPPTPRTLDFAAIYEEHYELMVGLAVKRFGIRAIDAQTLAHEVFFDFLRKGPSINDHRAWLIGGICNASRYYLRKQARSEPLPESIVDEPDPEYARVLEMWPDQLAAREAFGCVTTRCQLALRLLTHPRQ